jgi:Fanconi anemia group J protein
VGGVLSGDKWYSQQAFRALNQALGRCLRHRNDFGCVFFIDERFRNPRVQAGLSKWLRGRLQHLPKLEGGLAGLQAFFARAAAEFPHAAGTRAAARKASVRQKAKKPPKGKDTSLQQARYSEVKKGPLEVLWSNAVRGDVERR